MSILSNTRANMAVLLDASCGLGVAPTTWEPPPGEGKKEGDANRCFSVFFVDVYLAHILDCLMLFHSICCLNYHMFKLKNG